MSPLILRILPIQFTQFLSGLISDFASTASEYGLLETNTLLTEPSDPNNVLSYTMVLVNLSAERDVSTDKVRTICDILAEFVSHFPDNPDIALEYALVLARLTISDVETTGYAIRTIALLVDHFPSNSDIAGIFSMVIAWSLESLPDLFNGDPTEFAHELIGIRENPVIRTALLAKLQASFGNKPADLAEAYDHLQPYIDAENWLSALPYSLRSESGREWSHDERKSRH